MEGTHRQLGTRLTNTLCSDNADSHSFFDQSTRRHVHAVTAPTDTKRCITSHGRTNLNFLKPHRLDLASDLRCDHFVFRNNHFVCYRIHDRLSTDTTIDRINQTDLDLFTTVNHTLGDTLGGIAVVHRDNNILCNVSQLTRQVSTVRSFQSGISQTFSSTVSRTEVLQHRQAFPEVRLNGSFDNLAGWLGHQTTHTSKLPDLLDTTTSTGVRHQEHRVDVPTSFSNVIFHGVHHVFSDRLAGVRPLVQNVVVSFLTTHQTTVVVLLELHHFLLSTLDEGCFGIRRNQVIGSE